jgi:cytochrome c553
MSKKSLVLLLVTALTLSLALAVSMSFADDTKNGPEKMMLNEDGKKPAQFPHREHQERLKDCGTCHHYVKEGVRNPSVDASTVAKCDTLMQIATPSVLWKMWPRK